jgi:Tfp pilus assembly protein PilV
MEEYMKKIVAILLIAVIVLSLTACNTNNLAEYKKAFEKTDQIAKGQLSAEFSTVMDYNTTGLSSEEIKELNYYKDMNGSFNVVYDDGAEKAILRNYMNFGGLGYDFDLYINGKEVSMKLPVVGKYIKLNEIQNSTTNQYDFEQSIVSEETMKAISDKWVGLMKEENVFKGKDIILTTPDGEVKTTEYTLTLTDEQIKLFVSECVELAQKDESLKQFYDNYVKIKINDKELSFEETIKSFKENIENYKVENFNYTALVDIDGFIVNEDISYSIKAVKEDLLLRGTDFNMNLKTWDINKEQSFDFPVLTEENTIDVNNKEEMPDMMKDLFKNED